MKKGIMNKAEMLVPSESVQRMKSTPIEPYQTLANSIVCIAADDYKSALRSENEKLILDIESFFRSDWYGCLTSLDPEMLMSKLKATLMR